MGQCWLVRPGTTHLSRLKDASDIGDGVDLEQVSYSGSAVTLNNEMDTQFAEGRAEYLLFHRRPPDFVRTGPSQIRASNRLKRAKLWHC